MDIVDRDKPKKLYIQVLEILKRKMEAGEWPVGHQIPIEEELCRMYHVSKATIRLAVLELVRQGYLTRQQGRGTFVCERTITDQSAIPTSFKDLLFGSDPDIRITILAQTVMMPVDDIGIKLGIQGDKHLIYIKRLIKKEDEGVMVQEIFIPHYICPQLLRENLEEHSIFDILENKYNIEITRIVDFIDIVKVNAEESKNLGIPINTSVVFVEQHFHAKDVQIMYIRSLKKSGGMKISIELNKRA